MVFLSSLDFICEVFVVFVKKGKQFCIGGHHYGEGSEVPLSVIGRLKDDEAGLGLFQSVTQKTNPFAVKEKKISPDEKSTSSDS